MNLHDPSRHKTLNNLPAWKRGHFAIKAPTLIVKHSFPPHTEGLLARGHDLNGNENDLNENRTTFFLSIWLPIDELFGCMEFKAKIDINNLPQMLSDFTENPENFTEKIFKNKFGFTPQLRNKTKLNLDEYEDKTSFSTQTKPYRPYSRTRYRTKSKPSLSNLTL